MIRAHIPRPPFKESKPPTWQGVYTYPYTGALDDHPDPTKLAYIDGIGYIDHSPHIEEVESPPHYNFGAIECIEAIKAALTEEEFRGYCKGNNIKYTWREKYKGGNTSLQKAIWYLNQLVSPKE